MSSANFADIRVNGVSVSEAGFNAAVAGHFGVPVVMISGPARLPRTPEQAAKLFRDAADSA